MGWMAGVPAGFRCALLAALLPVLVPCHALEAVVVDADTGAPLGGAQLVVDQQPQQADDHGRARLAPAALTLQARAPGYERRAVDLPRDASVLTVALRPFRAKALYLSPYGIADAGLRGEALRLAADTEINALVIDVKGDRAIVPFPSQAYADAGIGTQTEITVRDMVAMVANLHAQGLYLIARVVTFKDDRLADAHPAWAVHARDGSVWHDREGLAWIDPFQRAAWRFSLAVAEEAAQLGFDEIQFDYLRFPDATGLVFSQPSTEADRVAAINGFLDAAQARLARYNVFIAADVFGYTCWNENDTQIGQQIEAIVQHVDYLSPMLYPSGFTFGIPGHRQPVADSGAIVRQSLQRALQRTGVSPLRLRPWLQAFRDYAFDHREFGGAEVREQVDAAESLGTGGWMLWNPHNRYSAAGLKLQPPVP